MRKSENEEMESDDGGEKIKEKRRDSRGWKRKRNERRKRGS